MTAHELCMGLAVVAGLLIPGFAFGLFVNWLITRLDRKP